MTALVVRAALDAMTVLDVPAVMQPRDQTSIKSIRKKCAISGTRDTGAKSPCGEFAIAIV